MPSRRPLLLALITLLALASPTLALDPARALTQYAHRIWQGQQGLPQSTIYCVRQTADGYLWLGTLDGPVRFDGVRFTPMTAFPNNISLAKTPILALAEKPDGTLILATDGKGVILLKNNTATQLTTQDGLPSDRATALLVDSQNNLWIATSAGLARYSDNRLTAFPATNLRALAETKDHKILVAGDGLFIFDGKNFQTRTLQTVPASATIQALGVQDGTLFVATSAGLVSIDSAGAEHRFTTADGLADDYLWCLTTSSDGALWAGTRDGFSRIRNSEIETFHAGDGLSQSTVYGIFEDKEGSLWVATKHGLNQFLDGRTVPVTTREGLASNDTGPILQDSAGIIWIGTTGAGLSRYDGHNFSTLNTANGLPSNRISALAQDKSKTLWVGTDNGVARLDDGRIASTYSTAQGLPSVNIRALLCDHTGQLWAGTAQGLAVWKNDRFIPATGDYLGEPVVALAETADGAIAAATDTGAVVAVKKGEVRIITRPAPSARIVDALYPDSGGNLWMGTLGGGLILYDGKRTVHFALSDGLFDDEIFAVVPDAQDRLWMACSKGVFSVTRSNLREFAEGKTTQIVSAPFSPTDALRTVECKSGVEPSACVMSDGRLWFATQRGVMIVDPARLPRRLSPPPVVIEEVAVDGRSEAPVAIESLPAGLKNLTFRYTGLSFIAPARITFRYQLEGFDRGWVDAGARREAFYTNLPPSRYHFRVQASNADGTWADAGLATAAVDFALAPAWYQHAWFIPLCFIFAAALGAMAFHLRVRTLRHRMQWVVAERSRIARELHDTLLQGFAGVTMEMQALSVRLPANPDRRTLEEIIRDAARCLKEARRSVAGLRDDPGSGGLAKLLEAAARELTANTAVELTLKIGRGVSDALPASVEYNLMRIAREAITNTLKHANAHSLEVGLAAADDFLVMEIRDDGAGFQSALPAPADHYGLVGMRERATEIGALFDIITTPGNGTLIRVRYTLHPQPQTAPETTAPAAAALRGTAV